MPEPSAPEDGEPSLFGWPLLLALTAAALVALVAHAVPGKPAPPWTIVVSAAAFAALCVPVVIGARDELRGSAPADAAAPGADAVLVEDVLTLRCDACATVFEARDDGAAHACPGCGAPGRLRTGPRRLGRYDRCDGCGRLFPREDEHGRPRRACTRCGRNVPEAAP